jgi:acyl-lipid omega-6 desaturase (Delta-12 desaturase)
MKSEWVGSVQMQFRFSSTRLDELLFKAETLAHGDISRKVSLGAVHIGFVVETVRMPEQSDVPGGKKFGGKDAFSRIRHIVPATARHPDFAGHFRVIPFGKKNATMRTHVGTAANRDTTTVAAWREILATFRAPRVSHSVWQMINTFVPYAVLWYLIYWSLSVSYWITVPLMVAASGFLVRAFIIFHDCCHGSFFKSRRATEVLGFIAGVVVLTPFHHWRWQHALHHRHAGNLDGRGTGDVWTMTVREYLEASRWKRFAYRLTRNPVVLFVIAPACLFLFLHRFPSRQAGKRERLSVYWTNLAILGVATLMGHAIGYKAYLLIQVVVASAAGSAGVWLFYVQHQFDGVYWARRDEWDFTRAALQGSSFYKLPRVLQWFSGNIGFHHIHHLEPAIPNYHLEKCHQAVPLFQTVKPVTLFASIKSLTFRLWDEQRRKLVGFGHLRALRRQQRRGVPC